MLLQPGSWQALMQLLIAQGLTLAYLVPLQVMLVRQMG